jgi:hypothetical protein
MLQTGDLTMLRSAALAIALFSGSSRVRVGAFLTKTGKKDPWIAAF